MSAVHAIVWLLFILKKGELGHRGGCPPRGVSRSVPPGPLPEREVSLSELPGSLCFGVARMRMSVLEVSAHSGSPHVCVEEGSFRVTPHSHFLQLSYLSSCAVLEPAPSWDPCGSHSPCSPLECPDSFLHQHVSIHHLLPRNVLRSFVSGFCPILLFSLLGWAYSFLDVGFGVAGEQT